jgi:succinylglutamate desuccinylase
MAQRPTVPGVRIFPGCNLLPRVTIAVLMHGNERAGWAAYREARRLLQPRTHNGTVALIVGNPAAARAGKRFLDTDLNRAFAVENLTSAAPHNVEVHRFREIEPYLRDTNILLDIHTASQPCEPFAICLDNDARHIDFARQIPVVRYITINWRPYLSRSTMAWVSRWNPSALAISIECGEHAAPTSRAIAAAAVRQTLAAAGVIEEQGPQPPERKPALLQVMECATTSNPAAFAYTRQIGCFSKVSPGQVIATEGAREIRAPSYNMVYVVLPAHQDAIRAGWSRDALYFAREVEEEASQCLPVK